MEAETLLAIFFMGGLIAGVFVVYMGLRQRTLQLEMQHRERMAMIEKGQIPLEHSAAAPVEVANTAGHRSLSIGIIVIGLGLALTMMLSFAAGSPEVGIGIGGAITILGGAFVVRSIMVKPQSDRASNRQ